MQKKIIRIFSLLFILSACRSGIVETPTATFPLSSVTSSPEPTATQTYTPVPPTETALPPSPTLTPTEQGYEFDVRTHPDAGLFVGDQVSFEVIPPAGVDLLDAEIQIFTEDPLQPPLNAQFVPYGIAGRNQATLYWAWNTTDLMAGEQFLTLAVQPLGYTWTHTVTLGLATDVPAPEPIARWATSETDCCIFYYLTETAAAREITATLAMADQQAAHAVEILGGEFSEPLVVTLMPRVLGQGGFASGEMYVSFLDRNYAGNNLGMVLHHEMVHVLDQRLGGDLRPSILVEGLAVYLTGGHYKPEDIVARTAALLSPEERDDGLGLDWYIPPGELADDFYQSQHEIGYLQAGALVQFMVEKWGWDAYSNFYREIVPSDSGKPSEAIDIALQAHFGITFTDLEIAFVDMLKSQTITSETVADVELTVSFFELMRRYQLILDPSAHFLTAWLPDGPVMRENGIVADLVRRPSTVENVALETLFVAADEAVDQGEVDAAAEILSAVTAVLDAIDAGSAEPFAAHPLAQAHYRIAKLAQEAGYQVEKIKIDNGVAQVIASEGWPEITIFEVSMADDNWILVSSQ